MRGSFIKFRCFAFILYGLFTVAASAQGRMGERPEPIDWVKKLDLTLAQNKQMAEIQENFRAEIMAIRGNSSGDPMEMMILMQDKQKQRDKRVKSILSKKQFKKYKKELKSLQDERRWRLKDRGMGKRNRMEGQRKRGGR